MATDDLEMTKPETWTELDGDVNQYSAEKIFAGLYLRKWRNASMSLSETVQIYWCSENARNP